jgi:hypothetical protein
MGSSRHDLDDESLSKHLADTNCIPGIKLPVRTTKIGYGQSNPSYFVDDAAYDQFTAIVFRLYINDSEQRYSICLTKETKWYYYQSGSSSGRPRVSSSESFVVRQGVSRSKGLCTMYGLSCDWHSVLCKTAKQSKRLPLG